MRQKQDSREAVEKTVRDIKRRTRLHFGAENKIRSVLQGLRGEDGIAKIYRKEGLHHQHSERIRLSGIDCPEKGQTFDHMVSTPGRRLMANYFMKGKGPNTSSPNL